MALVAESVYTSEMNPNRSIQPTIGSTNRKLLFVCSSFAFIVHLVLLVSFAIRISASKFKCISTSSVCSMGESSHHHSCDLLPSNDTANDHHGCRWLSTKMVPKSVTDEITRFWHVWPIKTAASPSLWFHFHLCMLCMQIVWLSGTIYTSFPNTFDLSASGSLSGSNLLEQTTSTIGTSTTSLPDSLSTSSSFLAPFSFLSSSTSAASSSVRDSTWFSNRSGISVSGKSYSADWSDWLSGHLRSASTQIDVYCSIILVAIQSWLRSQAGTSIAALRSIDQTRCLLVGLTLHYLMLSACFWLLMHSFRLHFTLCGCPSIVIRLRSWCRLDRCFESYSFCWFQSHSRWKCTWFHLPFSHRPKSVQPKRPLSSSSSSFSFRFYVHQFLSCFRMCVCFGCRRSSHITNSGRPDIDHRNETGTEKRTGSDSLYNDTFNSISILSRDGVDHNLAGGQITSVSSESTATSPSKQSDTRRRRSLRFTCMIITCSLIRLSLHLVGWAIPAVVVFYAVTQNPNDYETRR